jgi:hypothetical protein
MDIESSLIINLKTGEQIISDPLTEQHFRERVAEVLKQSPKDRQRVASELSALTGERITVPILNQWLAASKPNVRFPASVLKAFCELTGDYRPVLALLPDDLKTTTGVGEKTAQSRNLLREILKELEGLVKAAHPQKSPRRSKR